jgi:hypothetical protein
LSLSSNIFSLLFFFVIWEHVYNTLFEVLVTFLNYI